MTIELYIINFVRFAFWFYGILIFIRVISSWFPKANQYSVMKLIAKAVDPYLNIFRRFIPPIAGSMDISPIVAFFALQLIEKVILWAII